MGTEGESTVSKPGLVNTCAVQMARWIHFVDTTELLRSVGESLGPKKWGKKGSCLRAFAG